MGGKKWKTFSTWTFLRSFWWCFFTSLAEKRLRLKIQ
jgi:hypothetical protein